MFSLSQELKERLAELRFKPKFRNIKNQIIYTTTNNKEVINIRKLTRTFDVWFKENDNWKGFACPTFDEMEERVWNFLENKWVEPPFYNKE